MTMTAYRDAQKLLTDYKDRKGVSIAEHSHAAPFLLVLLRHVGCSFCRQTLQELSVSMKHITACGYRVGLVHMDADEVVESQFQRYGLQHLPRFHDANRGLYRALGLPRAPLYSVFKRDLWSRGIEAKKKYGIGMPTSDPLQLPGAFLIDQGVIVAGEPTLSPEEQPDFLALLIRSEAVA